MNAKSALCKALISGNTLNVKNCFSWIGLTNCAREVSRMVEKPFNVSVTRTPRNGKSRYGKSITWYDYKLVNTKENQDGIRKMIEYIQNNEK